MNPGAQEAQLLIEEMFQLNDKQRLGAPRPVLIPHIDGNVELVLAAG